MVSHFFFTTVVVPIALYGTLRNLFFLLFCILYIRTSKETRVVENVTPFPSLCVHDERMYEQNCENLVLFVIWLKHIQGKYKKTVYKGFHTLKV